MNSFLPALLFATLLAAAIAAKSKPKFIPGASQGERRDAKAHPGGGPTAADVLSAKKSKQFGARHVRVIREGGTILLCRNVKCNSWLSLRPMALREMAYTVRAHPLGNRRHVLLGGSRRPLWQHSYGNELSTCLQCELCTQGCRWNFLNYARYFSISAAHRVTNIESPPYYSTVYSHEELRI